MEWIQQKEMGEAASPTKAGFLGHGRLPSVPGKPVLLLNTKGRFSQAHSYACLVFQS